MNCYAVRPRPPRGAEPPRHAVLYRGLDEYAAARRVYKEEREVLCMLGLRME